LVLSGGDVKGWLTWVLSKYWETLAPIEHIVGTSMGSVTKGSQGGEH